MTAFFIYLVYTLWGVASVVGIMLMLALPPEETEGGSNGRSEGDAPDNYR